VTKCRENNNDYNPKESNTGIRLGTFIEKTDHWEDSKDEFVSTLAYRAIPATNLCNM
jgi:hypothetical protein